MIESVEGMNNLKDISQSTSRLHSLLFGAADYSSELCCSNGAPNMNIARSKIIEACSRYNLFSLDSPFFGLKDLGGLRKEVEQAKKMGFTG